MVNLPHWLIRVNDAELRDIYPSGDRALDANEVNTPLAHLPMLWELYSKLYELTDVSAWNDLATSTRIDAILAATFSNQTFVYRKSIEAPLEYPGTSITGSAARITSGTFDRYVRVSGSSTLTVQNTGIQTALQNNTTYVVEAGSNQENQIIEFFVSTSTDDFSEAAIYRQFWRLGAADTANSREIASTELRRWDDLAWYPGISLISGTAFYESQVISGVSEVVLRLEADAQLTLNKTARNPFKLFVRAQNGATLRLRDTNGRLWDYTIPSFFNWILREPTWDDFSWSPANGSSQGSQIPSTNGDIQSLEILTSNVVYIQWIGSSPPTPLPLPTFIYRAGVRDRGTISRQLFVGDVYPTNAVSDLLPYTPGVVPFARNIVDGVPGTLTGLPYAGYQNPNGWVDWNEPDRLSNVLDFLQASQAAYAVATDDTGPFAPVFTWNDINNVSQGGDLNKFGFVGFDQLSTSGEYQAQVGLWLAKAWNKNRSNIHLGELAMSWLQWLDQVYQTREDTLPPNSFPANNTAVAGHNPGVQALIGEAALYCNIAGGDPATTFRWIYRSLQYLDSQFIADEGSMTGSWAANQPNSGSLKRYQSWWHGSCLNFYSSLLINKPQITYPPCSEPLEIPTSEPFPEICCGAVIVPLDDYGNPILP